MSDIRLSSGKREQEIRNTFRNPLISAGIVAVLIVVVMLFRHPLSDFIHEHHQFFYVTLTLGSIPFAFFIFVLYSQYGSSR
jgi:Na+-driven multidrug efflux pump